MGIVNFNLMFYKDPELIRDMAEYWEYFTIETMRDAVEAMKDTIDAIWWWEDFAEKHGPLISPRLFRDFLLPHYRNVTDFLKKNKIDRVVLDSDGNTSPILDLMIEAGITGHWPLEVASGMDAITLRRKYGNELFIMGNLDKRELVKGGEHMKKEIDSKIPILKEMGGYIPSLDHDIPPDFTLDRYREYAEYMKKQLPY
jgi:uroporphyrinogen decarboxylase